MHHIKMRRARLREFAKLDDPTRTRFVIEEDDQGEGGEQMTERLRGMYVCIYVYIYVCIYVCIEEDDYGEGGEQMTE
jgi:hypothetical protein